MAPNQIVRLYWGVLLFIVVLNFPVGFCKSSSKAVVASLDSKWPHTSFLAETSEFLALESNQQFWEFVRRVFAEITPAKFAEYTARQRYEFALKQTEGLIGAARMDLLKLALSLRSHSPVVEMHRQMALLYKSDCANSKAAFVDLHGTVVCDVDALVAVIAGGGLAQADVPDLYRQDHVYPGSKGAPVTAVLYGAMGTTSWSNLHRELRKLASERAVVYVFRHLPPLESEWTTGEKVRLSGYGVELAIKSTEYKAQDDTKITANVTEDGAVVEEGEQEEDLNGFNFKLLKKLHPDLKDGLQEMKLHLYEGDELKPLKVWQVQDLSYQAAQRVVSAPKSEALATLTDIAHNFPLLARSLTRTAVKQQLRSEVEANQEKSFEELGLSAGDSAFYINGLQIDLDTLDFFQLLDLLKKEEKLSAGFFRMGFRREYLSLLMNLDLQDDASTYAIDFRAAYPEFVNDLDKDRQYRDWGNSVKLMIQPYFPGMIRPIARNFFNLIFFIDPSTKEGRNLMKIGYSFYAHQVPIRIGFVFVVNADKAVTGKDDAGVALLNFYNFAKIDRGTTAKALKVINELIDYKTDREVLTADDVISFFTKTFPGEEVNDVFGAETDYDHGRQAGAEFLNRSGLGKAPKVLLNGIPLDDSGLTADRFEETVINEIMKVTPKIQRAIMDGRLSDKMNVLEFIMTQPDVIPRLNKRILDADKESNPQRSRFLDFSHVDEDVKTRTAEEFQKLPDTHKNQYILQTLKHLSRNDDSAVRAVTIWVVGDFETAAATDLLYHAVKHLKHSSKVRVAVVHNPTAVDGAVGSNARIIEAALKLLPDNQARLFVAKLTKPENRDLLSSGGDAWKELAVHEMNTELFEKELKVFSNEFHRIHSEFATKSLDLAPGQNAIVLNGQVIALDANEPPFGEEDMSLLERYAVSRQAQVIADQIVSWEVEGERRASDLTLRVSALVLADPVRRPRQWVVLVDDTHSVVSLPADDDATAAVDLVAIMDPLSRAAQRLAPLLGVLVRVVNADLKLAMNSKAKLSEMPLKSFYRLVLENELQFAADGSLKRGPVARFGSLPSKQLLTLNVIPPEAWLVEAVKADYDLDNIKMDEVQTDVRAVYELEHILVEGHCFDEVTGSPPRGLQFTLGTKQNPVIVDTIVMANLGYFQLKASPGAWQLQLREGRSSEIYDITTHQNTDSSFNSERVTVLLDNFKGKTIRIRVSKKPGMLDASLLGGEKEEEETKDQSIWQSISSKLGGGGGSLKGVYDTINIFSLASGHLYERFIRIMMVSIRKNTKHPVKFWLLKNYLSPSFKKFLPYLAQAYKFDYEFVQYKWPRWLHQQTEKQRVMWGYKILFLDVLFPLDVKKIIYVDADQVVMADMMELMELDLEGAPYGYTPFCESRTEMDGFRFWKRGYWANHLGPRRYHISALYVVDLQRFRRIAAGDRLRGQYQGLSSDPNSLSNLDQDLPNNMIHQVNIKSLPQEWLWCETWCSDTSKKSAKTIDLCNNPQTKEPKLTSAMRIIPGWKEIDAEIGKVKEHFERGTPVEFASATTRQDYDHTTTVPPHDHGVDL